MSSPGSEQSEHMSVFEPMTEVPPRSAETLVEDMTMGVGEATAGEATAVASEAIAAARPLPEVSLEARMVCHNHMMEELIKVREWCESISGRLVHSEKRLMLSNFLGHEAVRTFGIVLSEFSPPPMGIGGM